MDFFSFLSMIICEVLYTWCLSYSICSTWLLGIRMSACFSRYSLYLCLDKIYTAITFLTWECLQGSLVNEWRWWRLWMKMVQSISSHKPKHSLHSLVAQVIMKSRNANDHTKENTTVEPWRLGVLRICCYQYDPYNNRS